MAKKGKKGGLGGLMASGSEIKKNIGPRAINGAIRVGSAFGTAFASSKIKGKITDPKKHKFVGMGALLIGTALDVVSNNEMVRSIGQGMQTVGGMDTIAAFIPQSAPPNANGVTSSTTTTAAAAQARAVNGLGYDELEEKINAEWNAVVNQGTTNGMGNAEQKESLTITT